MTEWHPQVVRIESVIKHQNADSLDIVSVLGDYPVIVKRNEYQVNDLAAYIPIDSIVPDTSQFYFLCPRNYEQYEENGEIKGRVTNPKYPQGSVPEKYRIIKAKRIREVYSQGMLIPLPSSDLKEGDSITELLSLTKWEEDPEEDIVHSSNRKRTGSCNEKKPVGWDIPYYDIEGLRKYINLIPSTEEVILSEKIHGSCMSVIHDGNRLWVKSRNFFKSENVKTKDSQGNELVIESTNQWWQVARDYDLATKLVQYPNLVFFGECAGAQKGYRYDAKIVDGQLKCALYLFDIWDLNTKRYLDYDLFMEICSKLELPTVPELYRGFWTDKEAMYALAEGNTLTGGKHIREGFVLRTVKERFEPKLQGRMQLKLIGQGYALKK